MHLKLFSNPSHCVRLFGIYLHEISLQKCVGSTPQQLDTIFRNLPLCSPKYNRSSLISFYPTGSLSIFMFSHRRIRPTTNDRLNSVLEDAVREKFMQFEGDRPLPGDCSETYNEKGA